MSKIKTKGEVFTKQFIIDFMLEKTYNPLNMEYVLEPGCGDGRFIISILNVLIKTYKDNHEILNQKIEKIYGIEIDQNNYNNTINSINDFLLTYPRITSRPNIIHGDALLNNLIETIKFDYIIGNPPYIRIHNLPKEYLTILQSKYEFLKNGMVDIYYGFFELYKKCLTDNGVLCYITPNSYLLNTSSEKIIEEIYKDRMFNTIYDFKSEKLFDNAATYSCITVLTKTEERFGYNLTKKDFTNISEINIEYNDEKIDFLSEIQNNIEGQKFSEMFKVKTGFATLADKVFVITDFIEDDNYITFVKNKITFQIEKSITKKCIKASKYNGDYHRVIFPYKKQNERNVVISEQELIENYPLTHSYLLTNQKKLKGRDKGKEVRYKWYEWGRSQGVNNTNGNKIAISTIFENNPFIFINQDVLIYSGYFIISEKNNDIFTDETFLNSLKSISKPVSKGWYSLQKKTLDNVIIIK